MLTKGERREQRRVKKKHAPIRNKPPGEARKNAMPKVRVFINGQEQK